jgi:hypothetical protein
MTSPLVVLRGLSLALGLSLLSTLAYAETAPKPADAPKTATTPPAADATKPAEANKAAAGAAVPVGTTKPEATKPAPTAPAPMPRANIDWKSMDQKARKAYMKKTVLPTMKKAFAAYDGKKYKNMSCGSCHGDGVEKGDYKMPNPKLPKLPADMAGFQVLAEKKPAAVKFMGGEVKPKMAAMLNMPEFTPQSGTGFGCGACHTTEGK